ncbi:MAG: hypothetical protein LBR55_06490, partial [Bacteroidales bacterium]|nr:hypothetical protein [Bacteroidales bacterium]
LNFLGQKAFKRCGWYPNKQYRLFYRQKTKWNNRIVHEMPEMTNTSLGFLQGDLLHYLCKNTEEYAAREQKYAILRAGELAKEGKLYAAPVIWAMAAFRFFRTYILQLGFLKGKTGWNLSLVNARMVYLKYSLAKS